MYVGEHMAEHSQEQCEENDGRRICLAIRTATCLHQDGHGAGMQDGSAEQKGQLSKQTVVLKKPHNSEALFAASKM